MKHNKNYIAVFFSTEHINTFRSSLWHFEPFVDTNLTNAFICGKMTSASFCLEYCSWELIAKTCTLALNIKLN